MPLPKAFTQNEMQTALAKIWTCVDASISNKN